MKKTNGKQWSAGRWCNQRGRKMEKYHSACRLDSYQYFEIQHAHKLGTFQKLGNRLVDP